MHVKAMDLFKPQSLSVKMDKVKGCGWGLTLSLAVGELLSLFPFLRN